MVGYCEVGSGWREQDERVIEWASFMYVVAVKSQRGGVSRADRWARGRLMLCFFSWGTQHVELGDGCGAPCLYRYGRWVAWGKQVSEEGVNIVDIPS